MRMNETVWEVVWKPRWPWLPWKIARERRAMRLITDLPGYRGRVVCSGMEILLFATEPHALKAKKAIGFREAFRLPGGAPVMAARIGWLVGRYVHRCTLSLAHGGQKGWLTIREPSGGWDAVDPEDRGGAWPPADGVRDRIMLRRMPGSRRIWIEWDEHARQVYSNIDEREAEVREWEERTGRQLELDDFLIGK